MTEIVDNCDVLATLDVLCPMHVRLDKFGKITHAGPTVTKLYGDQTILGNRFLEAFELNRPHSITSMETLLAAAGKKLHLKKRVEPQTGLKGVLMPCSDGGAIVNLSFGISILDAVQEYSLNASDFAATDLTIEMLYLVEAKSAAMEAHRKLNQRLQGAKIAAEEQAYTDTLTGLKNRRGLDEVLDEEIQRARRQETGFGVIWLDIDHFKSINDNLGHQAGDQILCRVALWLKAGVRPYDHPGRWGGDEFVVLLSPCDPETLHRIALRIRESVEQESRKTGTQVTVSVGGYFALPGDSTDTILRQADRALYQAKDEGRNRVCITTSEDPEINPA